MRKIALVSFIYLFFCVSFVFAAENTQHPLATDKEIELQKVARKKLYPGGQDEEPLKVQKELFKPTRHEVDIEPPPEE